MRRRATVAVLTAIMVLTGAVTAPASGGHGKWRPAESIETFGAGAHENFNTTFQEGCPFISADGKKMFIASDRDGGLGKLDIWVSTRASKRHPWSEPVNLGAPINSAENDFCPTLAADGKTFFFVSMRDGFCSDPLNSGARNGDIYTTRLNRQLQATPVRHLGCEVNSGWDEHSPFPIKIGGRHLLFYSSARPASPSDAPGDHDIYTSPMRRGRYAAGSPVPGINTTANEGQPNVRLDGRELFFWSNRTDSLGGADIYSAKAKRPGRWGEPQNLGANVNSTFNETRPSVSADGRTLYFGSTRDGDLGNIYVTSRH
jgi:hypothetical protein